MIPYRTTKGENMEKSGLSVIDNIKNSFDELFVAEKKVATYILENMSEVVMLNISDLANRSNASEATVVRTCKHLGYDGYYQMRLLISRDVGKYRMVSDVNETMKTSQGIFDLNSERVRYLSECVSIETLINVASIVMNARIVHIVGVGNTVPVVMDLGFRLERLGVMCTYSQLPEHYFNHIMIGNNSDVVIAISRTGASTQVIRAVEIARRKNMKVIVITGELNKQLTTNVDCVVHIAEVNQNSSFIVKPDSHLLELAINDAILYVIKNHELFAISENKDKVENSTDDIGLLLSEFKL